MGDMNEAVAAAGGGGTGRGCRADEESVGNDDEDAAATGVV
jgi:hypothetical protein